MNRILIMLFIVLTSVRPVAALNPATDEQKRAIQDQITRAARMDAQVGAAQVRLTAAELAFNESRLNRKKFTDREVAALEAAVRSNQSLFARAQDEQRGEFTKAIHMTIKAYGIDPDHSQKMSVMRWTSGRMIEWLPVMHDPEAHDTRAPDGKVKTIAQPTKAYAGVTYFDGVSYIDRDAFEGGVGWLAATLYHEHRHYEQYTTPGVGDKLSHAEREVEVCQKETDKKVETIFFNLHDPRDAKLAKVIEDYQDSSQQAVDAEKAAWREAQKTLVGRIVSRIPKTPPEDFDLRPRADAEVAREMRRAHEARAEVDRDDRDEDFLKGASVAQQLRDIRENADNLRLRTRRQQDIVTQMEFARRLPPQGQPSLPSSGAKVDFQSAPSEAWSLAVKVCGGRPVSQDDLDFVLGRLVGLLKLGAFSNPPVTSCETKLFVAMSDAARGGKSLSARWANSTTRRSYCKSAANEGGAVYRETLRAADLACYGANGIDDGTIADIVTRSYSNSDQARSYSQLDPCQSEIYLMLCEGTSEAKDWNAKKINSRVREIEAAQQTRSSAPPLIDDGRSNNGARETDRGGLNLSRPTTFVGGLHPTFGW